MFLIKHPAVVNLILQSIIEISAATAIGDLGRLIEFDVRDQKTGLATRIEVFAPIRETRLLLTFVL